MIKFFGITSILKQTLSYFNQIGLLPKYWMKEFFELRYWKFRKKEELILSNDHFSYFYTSYFQLTEKFFANKKILDIGCGPRGSLEWAWMASEKVGLDPLANSYLKLGAYQHKMKYVKAYSEKIPFADSYFDIVCAFNSLDHVGDLKQSCKEINRILKPSGTLLIIVDIHKTPTINEPQLIAWNLAHNNFKGWKVIAEKHFERHECGIYQSLEEGIAFDHSNRISRYGVLTLRLNKS